MMMARVEWKWINGRKHAHQLVLLSAGSFAHTQPHSFDNYVEQKGTNEIAQRIEYTKPENQPNNQPSYIKPYMQIA